MMAACGVSRLTQRFVLAAATLLPVRGISAQERVAESSVEKAAIEFALSHLKLTSATRIALDPGVFAAEDAPSSRQVAMRDTERNAYLTEQFRALIARRPDVVACVKRECQMRDADLVVRMSAPVIAGDSATITITSEQVGRRGMFYETNALSLYRDRGTWKVVRVEQLGIS